ncbi:MAG: YdbH domain-containing protein [Methylocystaceae bacterium]|nr:YdbH domain-containing protein [Methylocystaceae bacterium]
MRTKVFIAFCILLSVLGVGLATLYIQRIEIATRLIHWVAKEYQLPTTAFEISEIGISQIKIKNITLEDQIAIGSVILRYDLGQVLKGQLRSIHLDQVKINASRYDEGVFAAVRALTNGPQSGASEMSALPEITLENGHLLFNRDAMSLESAFSFEYVQGRDASFTLNTSGQLQQFALHELKVEGRLNEDFTNVRYELLGGEVEDQTKGLLKPILTLKGKGRANAQEAGFDLSIADQKDRFAVDVMGVLDIQDFRADLDVVIAEIGFRNDGFQPRDISPLAESPIELDLMLAASAKIVVVPDLVEVTGALDIKDGYSRKRFHDLKMTFQGETDLKEAKSTANLNLADRPNIRLMTFATHHDLTRNESYINLKTPLLDWGREGMSAQNISPLLKDAVRFSGKVQANSNLIWKEGRLSGDLAVGLDGFSLSSDQVNIENISTNLTFPSILPLKSKGVQQINMAEISSVVTFDKPMIRFALTPGKVHLDQFQAGFLGGSLSLDETLIGVETARHETVLNLQNLDVAEFFQLIGVEGLSGTGRLNGAIPLRLVDGDFEILQAQLKSQGSGILKLRSEAAKDMFGHAGEQMALVLDVLSNFHYESLSLSIDRKRGQNAVFTLGIEGNNPDVKDGYPFKLNINLETNLDKIIATLKEGYRLSSQALRYTIGLDK